MTPDTVSRTIAAALADWSSESPNVATGSRVAEALAEMVAAEVAKERQRIADREGGRNEAFIVRFPDADVAFGDPDGVKAWQESAVARHAGQVRATLARNEAIVTALGVALTAAATAATGGAAAAAPALVPGLLAVGTQIAAALNTKA